MTDAKKIVEELMRQRTPVVFRAGGPSMNPTIRDGESVRIRPLLAGDLRPGVVLLYRKNDRLVLHRMIRRKPNAGDMYVVADAALAGGDWVAAADILGMAEWVQRGERIRRLDSAAGRIAGWIRHALRPLRRALHRFRLTHHAQTPDRWWS
jgi:hypothetical protein